MHLQSTTLEILDGSTLDIENKGLETRGQGLEDHEERGGDILEYESKGVRVIIVRDWTFAKF